MTDGESRVLDMLDILETTRVPEKGIPEPVAGMVAAAALTMLPPSKVRLLLGGLNRWVGREVCGADLVAALRRVTVDGEFPLDDDTGGEE